MRGFLTSSGVANLSKASNIILKDYINGKLTYVQPPPGTEIDFISFNNFIEIKRLVDLTKSKKSEEYQKQIRTKILKMSNMVDTTNEDDKLIRKFVQKFHQPTSDTVEIDITNKHWRKQVKKKKGGKIRRKYKGIDDSPYEI